MEAVFLKLLNMSITAGWIVLVILALRLVLKKAPKGLVSMLWILVAGRLICPFSLESVWSLIPSAEPVPMDIGMMQEPAIDSGVPVINQVVNPVIYDRFAPEPLNGVNPLQVVTWVASHIWVIGVAVMVLYVIISYWRIYRRVRASLPVEKGVRVCDEIGAPFILGVIRPVIYLPSSLTGKELEYVLAHERAHLKRRDHFWKPLAFALLTVYWFHPLLWVAYLFFSRDIEMACDERVIRKMDAEEKKEYTRTLLACSVAGNSLPACPLAFGEVGVKGRVKSMKRYKKPSVILAVVAVLVLVLGGIFFLTNPKEEKNLEDTEVSTEQGEEDAEDISTGKVTPVEFDYEISYVGKESIPGIYEGALGDYHWSMSSVVYYPIHRMDSTEDMAAFREKFKEKMTFSQEYATYASYDTVTEKYDEEFFREHSLLQVYVNTAVGNIHGVTSIIRNQVGEENYFGIIVDQIGEITGQPMAQRANWILSVEVKKEALEGISTMYATTRAIYGNVGNKNYEYDRLSATYEAAYVGYLELEDSMRVPASTEDVEYLYTEKLRDYGDLEFFMLKRGFPLDESYDEAPSLREVLEKYDEKFFESHFLELIYVPASSGSYRYEVTGMIRENENGNPLRLYIQVAQSNNPEFGTMDMAGWMLVVPVEREIINPQGWVYAVWDKEEIEQKLFEH